MKASEQKDNQVGGPIHIFLQVDPGVSDFPIFPKHQKNPGCRVSGSLSLNVQDASQEYPPSESFDRFCILRSGI